MGALMTGGGGRGGDGWRAGLGVVAAIATGTVAVICKTGWVATSGVGGGNAEQLAAAADAVARTKGMAVRRR